MHRSPLMIGCMEDQNPIHRFCAAMDLETLEGLETQRSLAGVCSKLRRHRFVPCKPLLTRCNAPSTTSGRATHKESAQLPFLCPAPICNERYHVTASTTADSPNYCQPRPLQSTTLLSYNTTQYNPFHSFAIHSGLPLEDQHCRSFTFLFRNSRPPVTPTPVPLPNFQASPPDRQYPDPPWSHTFVRAKPKSCIHESPTCPETAHRIQVPSLQLMNQTHTQRPVRPYSLVY